MRTQEPPAHELHLLAHPSGQLTAPNFALVPGPVPRPTPGSALVRNVFLAVDPSRAVHGARSWPLRTALPAGPVIGRVVQSRDAMLPVGSLVRHQAGWSSHTLVARGGYDLCVPGASPVPVHAYLGVLGQPGLLAYAAVCKLTTVSPGETVFIAPADGAFGAAASRAARLCGAARVVGGVHAAPPDQPGPDFDAWIDLRARDLGERLLALAPGGVHAAVLGLPPEQLVRMLVAMAERGRVAWTADGTRRLAPVRAAEPLDGGQLSLVRRRGVHLIGYRTAHFQHLREHAEALLAPECAASRIALAQPVRRALVELPAELSAVINGSAAMPDAYQIVGP